MLALHNPQSPEITGGYSALCVREQSSKCTQLDIYWKGAACHRANYWSKLPLAISPNNCARDQRLATRWKSTMTSIFCAWQCCWSAVGGEPIHVNSFQPQNIPMNRFSWLSHASPHTAKIRPLEPSRPSRLVGRSCLPWQAQEQNKAKESETGLLKFV